MLNSATPSPSQASPKIVHKPGRDKRGERQREHDRDKYRLRELRRLIHDFRYGEILPDDPEGRTAARVMICHLANSIAAVRHARGVDAFCDRWLRDHCPWMTDDERRAMLALKRLNFGPQGVARWLGVTFALRRALGLNTFGTCDMSRDQREALTKQMRIDRRREQRRASGMKPRAEYFARPSASKSKPWEAFGWCRRTWERHGKPLPGSRVATSDPPMKDSKSLRASDVATPRARLDGAPHGSVLAEPQGGKRAATVKAAKSLEAPAARRAFLQAADVERGACRRRWQNRARRRQEGIDEETSPSALKDHLVA